MSDSITHHRHIFRLVIVALLLPVAPFAGARPAYAASWTVESESDPAAIDCDHLYYSNYLSGARLDNDGGGNATITNTVTSRRTGSQPPAYWSTDMAVGLDPDTGKPAAFYANYTTSNLTLYKHVSGTNTVTDEIAGGQTRQLPSGTNWGGITADPNSGTLYGAQNGGAPKLFGMNLATGASQTWTRGSNLTSVPANDPVFAGGSIVPDLFVDADGGVYYGISYSGATYVYRLDPETGTTAQVVKITGPASANGFDNYGMAFHNGYIYFGHYSGKLYRADPRTGESVEIGGLVQDSQVGRIKTEGGGSWPITDLASCAIAPNLLSNLVVTKTADTTSAKPGDTVKYTITVTNDGAATATGVEVTDDLSDVVDDATYNDDADASGGSVSYREPELTWTGDIVAGDTVTITYSVKVDSPPGGNKRLTNAVVGPDNSNCASDSTDPDCGTDIPVSALVVKKSASQTDAKPGDTVRYTVTVENTGNATHRDASFTDDLTGVLDDATYNDDAEASEGSVSYREPKLTWTGDVAAGQTVTVTYSATVDSPIEGDGKLANAVTGPDDSNCPSGGSDPDCDTEVLVASLHISKVALDKNPKPGDTVRYNIMIVNDGTTTYRNATVVDDLSGVIDDATYNKDAEASEGSVSYREPELTWTGDVTVDTAVTITYSVKVDSPPSGDKRLKNGVIGPDDSNCSSSGDDPDCDTDTPVPSLRIVKKASPGDPKIGDTVTYTVTVANDGEAAYQGASLTDDLSDVLDDADYNGDAAASAGSVSYREPELTWNGDLAVGETATVTYSVTVTDNGDKSLRNAVVGDGSNCPPDSADPDCHTVVPTPSLTILKTSDKAEHVKPGDTIRYTITMRNNGSAVARNASFTDDLSDVIDDAKYNDDAIASVGSVTYRAPRLNWTGDLGAGETVTIGYSATVHKSGKGNRSLYNVVTSPDETNCPVTMEHLARAPEAAGTDAGCHRQHRVDEEPGPGPKPDPGPGPGPGAKPGPDELPITGGQTGLWALLAVLLVIAGLGLRRFGRG